MTTTKASFSDSCHHSSLPPLDRAREILELTEARQVAGESILLSVYEAEALLQVTGEALTRLLDLAAAVRDEGLRRAGRPGVITFSKKVFLPITNLCRDRCHYCTFVESPRQVLRQEKSLYMSPEQILAVATQGAALGCKEALFTLGDRPEDRWPEARAWLDEHGYESTLHYVRDMAVLVRERTGLLPHLNPGVMSAAELEWLRPTAPSMGMMLETTSVELWSEKGRAHYGSPDKEPRVRLKVIEDAGRMRVPFTTGILVGIGETIRDRAESLIAIRESHERYGHVQEVIIQNFRAKPQTAMQLEPDLETEEYLAAIAVARLVMGPDTRIQVPPNLADHTELGRHIGAGIDDWGGVSPLTADHVNPERPWPSILTLRESTARAGFELRERLTAYPPYLQSGEGWVEPTLMRSIEPLMDAETGLANEHSRPTGQFSEQPGADSSLVPARKQREESSEKHRLTSARGVQAALERAQAHPNKITDEDLVTLLHATGETLDGVVRLADQARRYSVGETITVVRNGTLDPGAFAEAVSKDEGLAEIRRLTRLLGERGAVEICVQGKVSDSWGVDAYLEVAKAIKAEAPGIHLHAFRPADIVDGASRMEVTLSDYLMMMRDFGVDTIPGTGVKMLDEQHRRRAAPRDLGIGSWVSTILAAHRAGFTSTSVIVYGLGESAELRVKHLRSLKRIQLETEGFTELVVMPTPQRWQPLVPGRSDLDEHRAMHAVARLGIEGVIRHVQVGWPRLGVDTATEMLKCGADDLGGMLLAEGSITGGGAPHELSFENLQSIQKKLGRPIRERTTNYGVPNVSNGWSVS